MNDPTDIRPRLAAAILNAAVGVIDREGGDAPASIDPHVAQDAMAMALGLILADDPNLRTPRDIRKTGTVIGKLVAAHIAEIRNVGLPARSAHRLLR